VISTAHHRTLIRDNADRLNGITKRYLVGFGCDAHRSWDTKTNTWGQWYPIGNVTLPAGIYLKYQSVAVPESVG
jgi:hypothetical protein